jgi:hypothetical protein
MALTEAVLRTLVNDPAGVTEYLSTTEYAAIMAMETNEYRAAALSARAIAAQLATKVDMSVGTIKASFSQKYEQYMELAAKYDFRAREGGGTAAVMGAPIITGVSLSDMETDDLDTDRFPSKFKVGMFTNPVSVYSPDDEADDS